MRWAGSRLVNLHNIFKDMIDKEKERERGALVTSLALVGLSANQSGQVEQSFKLTNQ